MEPDQERPRPPMFPVVVYGMLSGCVIVGATTLGGRLLLEEGWPGWLVAAVWLAAGLVLTLVAAAVAVPVLDRFGHWACRGRAERGGRDG